MVPGVAGSNPVYRPICSFGLLLLLGFSPFDAGADDPRVTEALNLSYGEHKRQVLGVVSSEVCRSAPVILFFHGGSWRWGQKDYHREIGKQFARKGIVFVTANYRLYPEVRFPAFPEDVALASAWVRKNVRAHGGDGNNLFLMGHSAGAHSLSGRLGSGLPESSRREP